MQDKIPRVVMYACVLLVAALIFAGGCKKEGDIIVPPAATNEAPVISSIPGQVTDVGVAFSLDLATYVTDLEDNTSLLTFFPLSSGSFTGAVYNNIFMSAGAYTVNFSVIDSDGATALGSFNVTVNAHSGLFSIVPGTRHGVDFPKQRYDHAMAYDSARGVVVLFGGEDYWGDYFADTWEWDGTTWTNVSPTGVEGTDFPTARTNHAMAFNGTNVVLFGGGGLADTWEWDGTTWTLRAPATSPPARNNHAMAYNGTNIVLFGGVLVIVPMSDTWEWDGTTWIQRVPASSPPGRSNHAMAYNGTNIVLFGGFSGGVLADTWEWDNTTWTLRTPASSPAARNDHVMAYDGTNVVLFGGNTSPDFSETWTWDGGNWSNSSPAGTEGADNPFGRERAAMAYDSTRGVAVMFGGSDRWFGSGSYDANTWEWNGTSWTNESPQGAEGISVPGPRRFHAMAFDSVRNVAVLFGGEQGGNNGPEHYFDDTWEWNGTAWSNVSPTNGTAGLDWPEARQGHKMVYDTARSVVVLFGGMFDSQSIEYNDVWEWDGTTWTDVTPLTGTVGVDFPEERRHHAMAYDSARGVMVMHGGASSQASPVFDDTWEWDGTAGTWTEVTPTGNPGRDYPRERRNHAMVYDSVRGVMVLFGGGDQNVVYEDTWTWDGTVWTNVSPVGISGVHFPDLRRHHRMAYDSTRGVTVLFGGEDWWWWIRLDDTWEFNGTTWKRIFKSGVAGTDYPTARRAHAMTFDSNRDLIVLFGGNEVDDDEWCINDTWEF